jgi:predicted nucleic acid-binding Zn ribbon protein
MAIVLPLFEAGVCVSAVKTQRAIPSFEISTIYDMLQNVQRYSRIFFCLILVLILKEKI